MARKFKDWFEEQYGEMSSHERMSELVEEIGRLEGLLGQAKCNLKYQQRLFDAQTSALYGWNAAQTEAQKIAR